MLSVTFEIVASEKGRHLLVMPIDWKPEALPVAPAAGVVVRRHLLVMPIDWKLNLLFQRF